MPKGWSTDPRDLNTRIAYNNYASIDTLNTIFDPDDLTIYKYIIESKKRFQKSERQLFDWAVSLPERN